MACSQVLFRPDDESSRASRVAATPLTRPLLEGCSAERPIVLEPSPASWLCADEPTVLSVVLPVVLNASCALLVASAIVLPSECPPDSPFGLIGWLGNWLPRQ